MVTIVRRERTRVAKACQPEFEFTLGSETNGSVNWTPAVYERVREFGPLLSAGGRERVRLPPQRGGGGLKQRARPVRTRTP